MCGFHGVQGVLGGDSAAIIEVCMAHRHDQRAEQLRQELAAVGIVARPASPDELTKLARGIKHQGVIARVRPRPAAVDLPGLLAQHAHPWLLLILDRVQDPHNLGACLRVADGAGVDAVILPKDGACPVNASVMRAAAGAASRVAVFYAPNLARVMADLQQLGVWITGAAEAAERSLYTLDLRADAAIVLGAEGSGLRRLTRERCDHLARIPMAGSVSSLNVSVAAGLFLFEAVRQRSI